MRKIICALMMSVFFSSFCFAEDNTPKPYGDDEFPSWAYDLRRTEIITFGSLPFVTIGVSLVYGAALYFNGTLSSFPNPLDKSSDSFNEDQQKNVFMMSIGASCVLGLTDLLVSFIKHKSQQRKRERLEQNIKKIQIEPYFKPLYEEETPLLDADLQKAVDGNSVKEQNGENSADSALQEAARKDDTAAGLKDDAASVKGEN